MFSILWLLLVLQLMAVPVGPLQAHITYAVRQMKADTVIVVTYPAPGRVVKACSVFYDAPLDSIEIPAQEVEKHCWTPTNPIGDFDVWKNKNFAASGHYLACYVDIVLPSGQLMREYAYAIGGDS